MTATNMSSISSHRTRELMRFKLFFK